MARRVLPSAPSLSPLTGGRRVRRHRAPAPLVGGAVLVATSIAGLAFALL